MMEILKALLYYDKYNYSRNRALGMSYLNRFLIEEDAQFECVAPSCIWEVFDENSLSIKPIDEIKSKICCSHFIIAGGHNDGRLGTLMSGRMNTFIKRMFKLMRQNYRTELHPNIMVTFIGSERLECVQTDRFKKFYKEGGKIKYEYKIRKGEERRKFFPSKILDAYKSVGDDIEDFFQRNKNEIMPNKTGPFIPFNLSKSLFVSDNSIITFHLSLISDDEEKRIISKYFTVFKYPTTLHEAESNYALSVCYRQSFIVEHDLDRWIREDQVKWYRIDEPDIWQERIMQNYRELEGHLQSQSDNISYIESSDIESSCSDPEKE